MTADLSRPRRVHVLNAGGAGMSAIATVLAEMGHTVSGHDHNDTAFIEPLRAVGVDVELSEQPAPLADDVELVTVSTATPADHAQLQTARRREIDVLSRADVLGAITPLRRTVAISGTHGKTTCSAMLASAFDVAGIDPSYLVGARVTSLGRNAHWGSGDLFVVEGDESDGTFLGLERSISLVTNVEPDHLEYWGTFDRLMDGFGEFVSGSDEAVVCADDPVANEIGRRHGAHSYGMHPDADFRITEHRTARLESVATVEYAGGTVELALSSAPGLHNLRNAAGVFACGILAGVGADEMITGLAGYRGVARRFEARGQVADVTFVDSYDHLPTEVRSALAAARLGDWPRIVCVFQPHRYSRTEALSEEFGPVFADADLLVLTDIYAAGESPRPGVSGRLLYDAVQTASPSLDVRYIGDLGDVATFLADELRPGDLCLTLGAGDLTAVPSVVAERLAQR